MNEERIRELVDRADNVRRRLRELHTRSSNSTDRLSEISGEILARMALFEDASQSTIENLDPPTNARAFQDAILGRMDAFQADFERVANKIVTLPNRIEALASGDNLDRVEQSLTAIGQNVTETLDGIADNVADTFASNALMNASNTISAEYEVSAEILREAAAEIRERLESLGETVTELAINLEEAAETTGTNLTELWTERSGLIDEVFDGRVLNIRAQVEVLENRFETIRGRLADTFATLSALRSELTELTVDNAGPSKNIANVLKIASDTFNAVG